MSLPKLPRLEVDRLKNMAVSRTLELRQMTPESMELLSAIQPLHIALFIGGVLFLIASRKTRGEAQDLHRRNLGKDE